MVFFVLLLVVFLESFGLSILRRRISQLVVGADEGRLAVKSVTAETLRLSEVHSASLLKLGASTGLSASQKLTRILALGCEVFNVETGRIDKLQENNELIVIDEYTTIQVTDSQKIGPISVSQRAEIAQFVLNHDGPLIVDDVANSGFSTLLSANDDENQSYIGIGIVVNNIKYGVLSFSNHRVKASFDDWQMNLIRQFAFVVAVLIEKEMIAQQLVMLNRVAARRKTG
jgi:GAF domain-containing protein